MPSNSYASYTLLDMGIFFSDELPTFDMFAYHLHQSLLWLIVWRHVIMG
jgi:hypothetical protein